MRQTETLLEITPAARLAPAQCPAAGGAVAHCPDSNFFLEKLKTSIQLKEFDVLTPVAYEEAKPLKYDVVLFDRYPPKFLPTSGNFMFFRCTPPNGKIKANMNGQKIVYLHENTVLDWKREHPMLRGLNLGPLGNLM